MNLRQQHELTARYLNVGKDRVWFNPEQIEDINKAITRLDIANLVKDGAIKIKPKKCVSRFKIRIRNEQKKKGRQKGQGKRKGTSKSRLGDKQKWMIKIRSLRSELSILKEKNIITGKQYTKLYRLAKGNVLRNKNHLRLYAKKMQIPEDVVIKKTTPINKTETIKSADTTIPQDGKVETEKQTSIR
ncbi:MAG: 50S ribosomal protein L19e [DPANN group archaeon]|nr:50S ribosomal protein L19e [DPANN group archaeon]